MNTRAQFLVVGLGPLILVAACTVPNPAFRDPDLEPSWLDLGPGQLDGAGGDGAAEAGADRARPADARPWPDAVAWQCQDNLDCDDKLACTEDRCTAAKECQNSLKPGFCAIGGACVKEGELNPASSCESCQPAKQTQIWSPVPDGESCESDGASCTQDVCKGGACSHQLNPGSCLIGGICYVQNQVNPAQSCQACKPTYSTQAWTTLSDNTPCASDGHSCTADVCKAGSCTHDLSEGWCLISNICRKEGFSTATDPCNECVPSRSTQSYVFVAGKPCPAPSGQLAGMCLQQKCRGFTESLFEPKITLPGPGRVDVALNGVSPIPVAGEVWTAGEYSSGVGTGGILVRLPLAGFPVPVLTPLRLRGISYRLATGDGGEAWYHDGTKWGHHAKLEAALAGSNREAVWGAQLGIEEVFWLTGFEGGASSGVQRCRLGPPVACEPQTGLAQNIVVGAITGIPSLTGVSALWAVPTNADEDIYYTTGYAKPWTRLPPQGCQDLGSVNSTPCSNTPGDFRDVYASGHTDVWAVGSSGLLLRYDGSWKKIVNELSYQGSYTFTAVYSGAVEKLVTVVGHSGWSSGRYVSIFNYNADLDRWFGPINVLTPNQNPDDELRDIGGTSYSNLFMVGTRLVGQSTSNPRRAGWVLQLK